MSRPLKQGTSSSHPPPESAARSARGALVIGLGLALAVWAAFGQTLRHDFVNVDDDVYVTDNARVAAGWTRAGAAWAFTNLDAGFWHPLTWLSLMTDAQLHGMRAGGFHLTNVCLHLVNTWLVFLVWRRLTGATWRSGAVAALFAWHPLHVESVAWIAERKGLFSATFFLLALWAYARYAQTSAHGTEKRKHDPVGAGFHPIAGLLSQRPCFYCLALLCFAGGLMSKTMAVTLPLVLCLLDYWPLGRVAATVAAQTSRPFALLRAGTTPAPPTIRKLFLEKVPFLTLSLAAGWLTFHAEKGIGALAQGEQLPVQIRLANATVSAARYLAQTIWPADLTVFYPYDTSLPAPLVWGSALLLVAITAVVIRLRRRCPYLAVGWFWYAITLSPVSGLIQVGGHARADRYTYLPLIGIFLMAGWGLAELCGAARRRRLFFGAGAATVLTALLLTARAQTAHWRDSVSLWSHALASAPEHAESRHNLADALAAQGRWPEAVSQYQRALELKPDHVLAHDALGVALATQGKLEHAIPHFERALQLRPDFAAGHHNLSVALAAAGRFDEAMRHCEETLRLRPDHAEARQNLAAALAAQGRWPEASRHFQRALTLAEAQGKQPLAEAIRARINSLPVPSAELSAPAR